MKIFILILILVSSEFCQLPQHIKKRFVGIISDVKIVKIDNNICLWIVSNDDYLIKCEQYIPHIYIGDSLFVYWINYRKVGIGTQNDINIYNIEK